MADDLTQDHRRERLKALLASAPFGGNLSRLGQALGYKDGVFIRQMRDGERPISEKTVARISEKLPDRAGWFGASNLSPQAQALARYFDRASVAEQAMLARLVPDIDITAADTKGVRDAPGLDTHYGDDMLGDGVENG